MCRWRLRGSCKAGARASARQTGGGSAFEWWIRVRGDGVHPAVTAAGGHGGVEAASAPLAAEASRPGLGRERIRHALRRLPPLRREARHLLGGRRARDLDDDRARRARRLRRLVDRADRLAEARRLDASVGGHRPRLRLDAADLPLQPDDRRHPLLAAPGHRAPAALARQGALHRRDDAHSPRRRALRGRPRRAPCIYCWPTAKKCRD